MASSTKFWIEDPCILLTDFKIVPTNKMTLEEKMNAMTRLIIILTVVLYFIKFQYWLAFAAISIVSIIIYYASKKEKKVEEPFTVTPTYVSGDFSQTVVSPTYSEEWQIPPPAYDLYTNVPLPEEDTRFEEPLLPQSYPYGQYLTTTNLLPSDEYYTHTGCGGTQDARSYANSAFLRNDLAYRDNMTRIYKKKLERRFRHNTNDTFSPYQSY